MLRKLINVSCFQVTSPVYDVSLKIERAEDEQDPLYYLSEAIHDGYEIEWDRKIGENTHLFSLTKWEEGDPIPEDDELADLHTAAGYGTVFIPHLDPTKWENDIDPQQVWIDKGYALVHEKHVTAKGTILTQTREPAEVTAYQLYQEAVKLGFALMKPTDLGMDIKELAERGFENCPECQGHGKRLSVNNIGGGIIGMSTECNTCHGTGLVSKIKGWYPHLKFKPTDWAGLTVGGHQMVCSVCGEPAVSAVNNTDSEVSTEDIEAFKAICFCADHEPLVDSQPLSLKLGTRNIELGLDQIEVSPETAAWGGVTHELNGAKIGKSIEEFSAVNGKEGFVEVSRMDAAELNTPVFSLVRCPNCRGTGEVVLREGDPEETRVPCSRCKETGKLPVTDIGDPAAYQERWCANCGKELDEWGKHQTCMECGQAHSIP